MPRTGSIWHQVIDACVVFIELRDNEFHLLSDELVRGRDTYLVRHDFEFISLLT